LRSRWACRHREGLCSRCSITRRCAEPPPGSCTSEPCPASSLVTAKEPISEAARPLRALPLRTTLPPSRREVIRRSERQAPYLSGSTGAARGQAHGQNPPSSCGRGRGKRLGEGALRVCLPPRGHRAGGRTHLAKGLHVLPQRRQTPGILPGSLPPSRVESLANPATERLRSRWAPMYPWRRPSS